MRVPSPPRWARATLAAGVAAAILAGSVLPAPGTGLLLGPFGLVGADKWSHAVGYGTLTATVAYALLARSRRRLLVVAVAAATFGLLVEGLQYGLPWRSFDLADAAANAVGALAAAGGWRWLRAGHRLEPAEESS